MKSLSEIRHLIVLAAQKEYDDRIARGVHPYSIASYHFNDCIYTELTAHIGSSILANWKADDWKRLQNASGFYKYEIVRGEYNQNVGPLSNGLWAVSAYLSSTIAWATPGFAEAYSHHARYGG